MIKELVMKTVLLAFTRFMLSDPPVATYFCNFILKSVLKYRQQAHILTHIYAVYLIMIKIT